MGAVLQSNRVHATSQTLGEKRQRYSRLSWVFVFGLPLATYFCIAARLALLNREYALGDAVCYIRRALYLCRGDFHSSVSGYWGPLISWSIAPLMWLGYDGLYAARAVLVFWGAAMVVTFGLLLYRFTWLNDLWKLAALMVVALATAEVAGNYITPDVIVAAWLFAYFAVAVHPELMKRRRLQVLAGVLGGVAYLAKAYAFPFVLVHWIVTVLMWSRVPGSGFRVPGSRDIGVWLWGMVGFGVVAGAWVGVLSWKYERFTFSTSGPRAHAYVGPARGRSLPEFGPPPDPYIVAWENPETIPHPFWSPWESRAAFVHQLRVVRNNLVKMRGVIEQMDGWHQPQVVSKMMKRKASVGAPEAADRWHPGWLGVLASPVLLLLVPRGRRWMALWVMLTMALYISGYLLVYFEGRYIWFVILPLSVLLCLSATVGMRWPWGDGGAWGWVWKALRGAAAMIVLAAFAIGAEDAIRKRMSVGPPVIYRRVAVGIRQHGLKGSIAGNHALKAYPIAMHLDEKFLLFPLDDDLDVVERKLREAKTGMVLVWGGTRPAYEPANLTPTIRRLVQRPTWRRVEIKGIGGAEVYVPVEAAKRD